MSERRPESPRVDNSGMSKSYTGPVPTKCFPTVRKKFASIDEVLTFITTNGPFWPKFPDSSKDYIADEDYHGISAVQYFGTKTWDEAKYLARYGWMEGCRLLLDAERDIPLTERSSVGNYTYDVAGVIPDVPRFIAGEPEYMIDFRRSFRETKPIIRVALSPACSYNVSPAERANWGAAVVSWIRKIEFEGGRVEIRAVHVCETKVWSKKDMLIGPKVVTEITLKQADKPLVLPDICFWLMHNAAHRRIQFAIRERLDIGFWYGSGNVYGFPITDHDQISNFFRNNELIISIGNGCRTVSEGLNRVSCALNDWKQKAHH